MKLLVAGMHRSGTSAVARLLWKLGLPTAADDVLMAADDHNRLGHWEVRALTDFNDALLAELGGHWAAPPPPGSGAIQVDLAEGPRGEQARDLVRELLPSDGWFWKDPRISLLLPFWRRVLEDDIVAVLVHRRPTAVAASLARRNGFSTELSMALWQRYVGEATANLGDVPTFAIDFDTLVETPDQVIEPLRGWLAQHSFEVGETPTDPIAHDQRHHVEADDTNWPGPPQLDGLTGILETNLPGPTEDPFVPLSSLAVPLLASDRETAAAGLETANARVEAAEALDEVHRELATARSGSQQEVSRLNDELALSRSTSQREITRVNSELDSARFRAEQINTEFAEARAEWKETLDTVNASLQAAKVEIAHLHDVIAIEFGSTSFQTIAAYRRAAGRALPVGSRRRSSYETIMQSLRTTIRRRHRTEPIVSDGESAPQPIVVPTHDRPVASLIIPVHGGTEITEQVLRSIGQHTAVPYEVIVVDDQSPDDVPQLLERVEGINLITNEVNQGYLRSTNLGAAAASGEFIVLLNSDIEVTEGWLAHLLDPFSDPEVGAVGAQLVYPDGHLQEAGSIVWSDGDGWNYGKNGRADRFDVMRRREVDYCSAACLAVRRDLWNQLGGFDERFIPAYYEDADLCFGIRALGKKVVYQPRARIVHHEGGTHGTDTESGMKAHQVTNRENFIEKWGDELAHQYDSDPLNVRRAADRETGPCVLVVDHVVPAPDRDAGSLRMSLILELLRQQGYRVRLFPDNQYANPPYERPLQDMGIEVAYGAIDPLGYLREHRADFDLVILSRPQVAIKWLPILRDLLPDVPIVYDMVDLHRLREERRAGQTGDATERSAEAVGEIEDLLVRVCDLTFAVTENEAAIMREREPGAEIVIIPTIHERTRSLTPFDERAGLLFVGSWAHLPNRDAIAWLVDEIQPMLRDRLPGVATHIVGSDVPPDIARGADDVIVHGWVEDLDEIFDQVRLSIAPLRYGAGMKGKVGDSLARGIPTVVTSIAAEGFDLGDFDLRPVDTAEDFVDRVFELYTDRAAWEATAAGGFEEINRATGAQAVALRLKQATTGLIRGRSPFVPPTLEEE